MANNKVVQINLERGFPTVDTAIQKMKNDLTTNKGRGCKAAIIIHGFGSTGEGGGIKVAVRKVLAGSSMQGIVRSFCGGEDWVNRKREIICVCQALRDFERDISGNVGVTVVVLR